jgi:DNA-binding MarR family transcriptional regulator
MSNKSDDITAKVVIEFTRILFSVLAVKYGGDRTLNELRIINQLVGRSLKGRTCSVTGIHKATGIPIPTVSRCVTNLQSEGLLYEQQDPNDGRKRLISLSARFLEATSRDVDGVAQQFNDCRAYGLPG